MDNHEAEDKSFNIVKFSDGKLGIVPENWMMDTRRDCVYPKVNSFTLNSYVESYLPKKDDWPTYGIEKIYCNTRSFNDAKVKFVAIDSEESAVEDQEVSDTNLPIPVVPNPPSKKHVPKRAFKVVASPNLPTPPSGKPNAKNRENGSSTAKTPISRSDENFINCELYGTNNSSRPSNSAEPIQRGANNNPASVVVSNDQLTRDVENEFDNFDASGPMIQLPASVMKIMVRNSISTYERIKKMDESTLQKTLRPSNEDQVADTEPPPQVLSCCPLETRKAFRKFNHKLRKSLSMRNKLRIELSILAKDGVSSSCRAMAARIMSDELASNMTWKGRSYANQTAPKSAFVGTAVHDIIYQSVNLAHKIEMKTEAFQGYLSDWFTQVKFRSLRRKERAEARKKTLQGRALLHPAESSSSGSASEEG